MSDNEAYENAYAATDPGDIAYWKNQVDMRWTDFYTELEKYSGDLMNGKPTQDELTGQFALETIIGSVSMKLTYGLDGRHLDGWVLFLDGPPRPSLEPRRELAWLHLSRRGWVNIHGEHFADMFGRPSVQAVLRAVVASKLHQFRNHLNTTAGQFPRSNPQ